MSAIENKSTTDQLIWSTAIHEAGHAVIGRVLGLKCGQVTIIPDEINGEAGHAIIAQPFDTLNEYERLGEEREIHLIFRDQILAWMAGAEAEIEILGHWRGGDGDDQQKIRFALPEADLSPEQWRRSERRMRAKTRGLVRRHREKIEHVARALIEHRTLQADEIDALVK